MDLSKFIMQYLPGEKGKDAAKRWTLWMEEIFKKQDVKIHYTATTDSKYNQLIAIKDIHVVSSCPHHLLPVILRVHIGYLPRGKVLGLSKFVRIARALSSPRLQEEYTEDLVGSIIEGLQPKWTMVVVQGRHQCMSCRGVFAEDASVITSAVRRGGGVDSTEIRGERLKQEFLRLVESSL